MHRAWAFALLTACYQPGALPVADSGMEDVPRDVRDSDAPPDGLLDQCPPSYLSFGTGKYRLHEMPLSWFEGENACEQDRQMATSELVFTHLAIISSAEEQAAVGTITSFAYWVGYTDLDSEGAWHHITSESSDYPGSAQGDDAGDPWNTGEPNGSSNENCAIISSPPNGPKFDDRSCTVNTQFRTLCECDTNQATLPGG